MFASYVISTLHVCFLSDHMFNRHIVNDEMISEMDHI